MGGHAGSAAGAAFPAHAGMNRDILSMEKSNPCLESISQLNRDLIKSLFKGDGK